MQSCFTLLVPDNLFRTVYWKNINGLMSPINSFSFGFNFIIIFRMFLFFEIKYNIQMFTVVFLLSITNNNGAIIHIYILFLLCILF